MKRMFSVFLLITVWLLVTPFLQAQSHVDKVLKDEITSDLKENILSFWERYSVDSSGGFYGSLGRDGAPIADAPKGGVLNARILWTFSTAYRMYGDTAYRKLADRAQRYFIDHFIDSQYWRRILADKSGRYPIGYEQADLRLLLCYLRFVRTF